MPTTATWYHANVKSISRGNNKTYVGAVAYITGEKIYDRENKRGCYRGHPGEVLSWGIVAPDNAPAWFSDKAKISKIANEVQASETRSNAQFSNHWDIALWRHATPEQNEDLMRRIATRYSERYKVIVPYAVHAPSGEGSDDNQHGHLVPNMRRVDAGGIGDKATEITDGKSRRLETEWVRRMIAEEVNLFLASVNSDERISHESYRSRGILKEATIHLGNNAWQAEKRGEPTKFGEINRGIRERNAAHDAEMSHHDLIIDRLKKQGVPKVEFTDQQFADREADLQNRIEALRQNREALEQFDAEYEEEQKRLARTSTARDDDILARINRGDVADANDRWAMAMHNSHNPRRSNEENLSVAVGLEAEQFRKEQSALRQREADESDPGKKKMLEYQRQIEACDYMALGAEKCARITGFVVGRADNEISNRDREHAAEWKAMATKLREDRADLKQTIDKGMYEEVETFLKDQNRGWKPVQRGWTEVKQTKEQSFGLGDREHGDIENQPNFRRDQPAAWRDLGREEIMEEGARYRLDMETGKTQVQASQVQNQPEIAQQEGKPEREGAPKERTDDQINKENVLFDQDLAQQYKEASRDTGRSMGGMSR